MATRAILGYQPNTTNNYWTGVYVHSDGYPAGWPSHLPAIFRDGFAGDVQAAINGLIVERTAGWSSLIGDWNKKPLPFSQYTRYTDGQPAYYYAERERNTFSGYGEFVEYATVGDVEYAYIIKPHHESIALYRVKEDSKGVRLSYFDTVSLRLADNQYRHYMRWAQRMINQNLTPDQWLELDTQTDA